MQIEEEEQTSKQKPQHNNNHHKTNQTTPPHQTTNQQHQPHQQKPTWISTWQIHKIVLNHPMNNWVEEVGAFALETPLN